MGTEEEEEYLRTIYPDCTPEQRASVVPYSLALLQAESLDDQDESTVISSGIVSSTFNTMSYVPLNGAATVSQYLGF